MTFSNRTSWHRHANRLSELLERKRQRSEKTFDLTLTNPTDCGFMYPEHEIISALANAQALNYYPDPRGLLFARESVAKHYQQKQIYIEPSTVFLTASTSEAYSHILKLLCNAGESALVPKPSYPLFEYLAQINDVELTYYRLFYDHGWHIDLDSIAQAITQTTKAIVLIHPHNPTGMFLKQREYDAIKELALNNNLALIVDEVFIDYCFEQPQHIFSTAVEQDILTFTLNGISKMCGLPQMKLGWIVVGGKKILVQEACERLEILCDTFLSVNTPVQLALPVFLQEGRSVQEQIHARTKNNYLWLTNKLTVNNSSITALETEGGWYALLRFPAIKTDEQWAIELLEQCNVYVHPGYFFDFEDEGYLIVSLLVEENGFQSGIQEMIRYVESCC